MMGRVTRGVALAFHSTISMARLSSSGIPTTETKAVALSSPTRCPVSGGSTTRIASGRMTKRMVWITPSPRERAASTCPRLTDSIPARKYSIMKASALRKSPHTPAAKGVLWISRNGSA